MGPATRAEFTVNQRSGDLVGTAVNLAAVTTILPQDGRTTIGSTERTVLDEIPKALRILKIEVAVHPCEL